VSSDGEAAPAAEAVLPGQGPAGMRDERDRFVGFAFAAADLLLELSIEGEILFAAGASRTMVGAEAETLVGTRFAALILERDRAVAELMLKRACEEGRVEPVTLAFIGPGGEAVHATASACLLPEKDHAIYLAIMGARPQVATAALRGTRDPETGLLDGPSFTEAARETLANAQSIGETLELALLRLQGLDELRSRAKGNGVSRLLSDVGTFLRAHSIGGSTAGRISEDKFGLIRSRAATKIVLSNEIERLSRACDPAGKGVRAGEVGVDIDAAGLTSDDATKALAFTLSRFAGARSEDFSIASLAEGFRAQISETVSRISRLKAATSTSRMTVAFQPIVALGSNLLHHHEMLARFDRNKSPSEMIQFAEKVGMIEEIDLAMCQRAIETLIGMKGSRIDLAVNISGKSLDSDMFVEALMKLLEPHANLRRHMLFEITESTAMTNLQRVERILIGLRQAGYRICLDDFGAGASSFPYLQALSVDFVKIDGGYVARMGDSAKDRAILKAMVAMCRDLGIGMIAEMIERVEQAEDLHAMGIAYGQGFLFGRPAASLSAYVPALGKAAQAGAPRRLRS
jgi:EAL domain-containing protein (putative c-di-GMP-specific phosphodiesterase class I)